MIYHIDKLGGVGYSYAMEKCKPHHVLNEVKKVIADPRRQSFTLTALQDGAKLNLTPEEMEELVPGLSPRDFYKSMTTYADHHIWQDVYHTMTRHGDLVYVKIGGSGDQPPVISFKKK